MFSDAEVNAYIAPPFLPEPRVISKFLRVSADESPSTKINGPVASAPSNTESVLSPLIVRDVPSEMESVCDRTIAPTQVTVKFPPEQAIAEAKLSTSSSLVMIHESLCGEHGVVLAMGMLCIAQNKNNAAVNIVENGLKTLVPGDADGTWIEKEGKGTKNHTVDITKRALKVM